MSASLVGSEMCIRDRLGCSARASAGANGATATVRGAPNLAFMGFRTVSYTHLTLPTICSV
eukprot:4091589-Alexandrium_andersonii.AAC.1